MTTKTSSQSIRGFRRMAAAFALVAALFAGDALAISLDQAGQIDTSFKAAQTLKLCGCLRHNDLGHIGVVQVFKVSKAKLAGKRGAMKLQATAMAKLLLFVPGGKIKSKTLKLTLDINTDYSASGKATLDLTQFGYGNEEFTMTVQSDGIFYLSSANITMLEAVIGGTLTATQYNFIANELSSSLPLRRNEQFITKALPDGLKGSVEEGKRFVFPTGEKLKLLRLKVTLPSGEKVNDFVLMGLEGNPNPSQLKVNYSPSAGKYKVAFKVHSIETKANGSKVLRKYSVTGYGFIIKLSYNILQNGYAPVGCSKFGTMADGKKWTVMTTLLTNLRQPIN